MNEKETLEELRAALAEIESGGAPAQFAGGHGIESRLFVFSWRSEALSIEFRLPWERVLSDESVQADDLARIGAAVRLAILLLAVAAEGKLLADGEASLSVSADRDGESYAFVDAGGEVVDAGGDWAPLVARLENSLPKGGPIQVIWP